MKKLTEYLNTAAAADYLGVAHNTIRKRRKNATSSQH